MKKTIWIVGLVVVALAVITQAQADQMNSHNCPMLNGNGAGMMHGNGQGMMNGNGQGMMGNYGW
jgi:hypothetical protein